MLPVSGYLSPSPPSFFPSMCERKELIHSFLIVSLPPCPFLKRDAPISHLRGGMRKNISQDLLWFIGNWERAIKQSIKQKIINYFTAVALFSSKKTSSNTSKFKKLYTNDRFFIWATATAVHLFYLSSVDKHSWGKQITHSIWKHKQVKNFMKSINDKTCRSAGSI